MSHSALRGNTDLISAVANRQIGKKGKSSSVSWDSQGFPADSIVPYKEKVLNREDFFTMPQQKEPDTAVPSVVASHAGSHVGTREASPREK